MSRRRRSLPPDMARFSRLRPYVREILPSPRGARFRPPFQTFLAYSEESDSIETANGLEAPNGDRLVRLPSLPARRFRLSGISLRNFRLLLDAITPVSTEPTQAERIQRRSELSASLSDMPIPNFDLYVPANHPLSEFANAILVRGHWCALIVYRVEPEAPTPLVVVGDAQLSTPEYFSLGFIGRLTLAAETRLRDIFSLAHLADAEFGRRDGGTTTSIPSPVMPPQATDGVARARQSFEDAKDQFAGNAEASGFGRTGDG